MALVSLMVFIIMEIPPGDYADRYAFRKYSGTGISVTAADVQAIRVDLGLDRPMLVRYFDWIGGIVVRGDFGQAFAFETSVNKVIGDKVWLTSGILFATLILTYLISIPIGIYAAVRRGSAVDYGLTVFSYLGLALPNFLLALVMLYFANRWFGSDIGGAVFGPLPRRTVEPCPRVGHAQASMVASRGSGLVCGCLSNSDGARDNVGRVEQAVCDRCPRAGRARGAAIVEISCAAGDQPDCVHHWL
jgi:ABC-type dipeptide/oligopeptide/nickel transport system permease component